MKLWMQIMILVALGLVAMSSQSDKISSQFDGQEDMLDELDKEVLLRIPIYSDDGRVHHRIDVNKNKLRQAIVDEFNSISKVYRLAFLVDQRQKRKRGYGSVPYEVVLTNLYLNFTVETTTGVNHRVHCRTFFRHAIFMSDYLDLWNCGNDQVVLGKGRVKIPYDEIEYEHSEQPAREVLD